MNPSPGKPNPHSRNLLLYAAVLLGTCVACWSQAPVKGAPTHSNTGASIEQLQQSLAMHPEDAALRINLGQAYYRSGDLARAREQFARVYQEHPDNLQAAILLGYTYNKLGRATDTVELLERFEAGHPSDLDLKYAVGFAMIQTGREHDGIVRMETVARARNTADAWMIAGSARFALRQFKEALADAEHAIQANPAFPRVWTLAGQAHYATGMHQEAAQDFQHALRQDARDFTANLYLGILRFDDHDLETAQPLLELALSIHPQDPLTRLELARLRNLKGDSQAALELLEDLAKTDPDYLDPHIELAALYYKLHRAEDGKRERDIVQRLESKMQEQGPRR